MSAPIVYKWDDTDAPILRGINTSFIEIVTACLIDGYGDKAAPGGWTKPFENAEKTKACFRNDENGTGFFLQIDNTGEANKPIISAFESMANVDTGSFSFGSATPSTSNTADVVSRKWFMIADPRFFCLVLATNSPTTESGSVTRTTRYTCPIYFGDIIALSPLDAFACIFGCLNGDSWDDNSMPTRNTPPNVHLARNASGGPATKVRFSTTDSRAINPLDGYLGQTLEGIDGGTTYATIPVIVDGDKIVRGFIPGLYTPFPNVTLDCGVDFNGGDMDFIHLCGEGYNTTIFYSLLFDKADWRL